MNGSKHCFSIKSLGKQYLLSCIIHTTYARPYHHTKANRKPPLLQRNPPKCIEIQYLHKRRCGGLFTDLKSACILMRTSLEARREDAVVGLRG